jgi:hypothetical protein
MTCRFEICLLLATQLTALSFAGLARRLLVRFPLCRAQTQSFVKLTTNCLSSYLRSKDLACFSHLAASPHPYDHSQHAARRRRRRGRQDLEDQVLWALHLGFVLVLVHSR